MAEQSSFAAPVMRPSPNERARNFPFLLVPSWFAIEVFSTSYVDANSRSRAASPSAAREGPKPKNEGRGNSSPRPLVSAFSGLDGGEVPLLAADAHGSINVVEEDLSIADLPRVRGSRNGIDSPFHLVFQQHQFHLDLRDQIDIVFPSPKYLGVALLATVSPHFRDSHAFDAELRERLFYRIEPVRSDNRFDLRHVRLSIPFGSGRMQRAGLVRRFRYRQSSRGAGGRRQR